jgi:hypothetical protein
MTARHQEEARMAYRTRTCSAFARHGIRFQDEVVSQAPNAPWLELHEGVDLDEASGEIVTTIRLCFNRHATGTEPVPSESDVTLYAQHQRDKQRLIAFHGMEALPWPHTAYEGRTDFTVLFPERLALNRDLLFVAFADLSALLRYARVLQSIARPLSAAVSAEASPPLAVLATTARYLALMPLLHQRLYILATAGSAKVAQRQVSELRRALAVTPLVERLRTFPAFVDAYTYFHTLAESMRPHLDTPLEERASVQSEERQPHRPVRRKRRQRPPRGPVEEEC